MKQRAHATKAKLSASEYQHQLQLILGPNTFSDEDLDAEVAEVLHDTRRWKLKKSALKEYGDILRGDHTQEPELYAQFQIICEDILQRLSKVAKRKSKPNIGMWHGSGSIQLPDPHTQTFIRKPDFLVLHRSTIQSLNCTTKLKNNCIQRHHLWGLTLFPMEVAKTKQKPSPPKTTKAVSNKKSTNKP
ncbi:uncharacterized protein ARMOST_21296 [Armillaria ostoyae]|uniref:Uncharacterized protein n=1 Tax=Armillaria ostoyae TaxID=47428 RepID=A0A284S9T5_ARMOS|nr:uncharacterized protein ARMOST_21296 [Armillaria ostoyae]